ncbi:MAG: ABC transporter permease [Spirochaetia bacterium]
MRFKIFTGLCAVCTFLLPLYTVKPNRIQTGSAVWVFQLPTGFWAAAVILIFLIAFIIFSHRHTDILFLLFSLTFMTLLLAILHHIQGHLHIWEAEEYGRISFSAGFWVALLTIYLLLSWAYRNTRHKLLLPTAILLTASGVILFILMGSFEHSAILLEYQNRSGKFLVELLNHVNLSLAAVGTATVIGIPAGIWAARSQKYRVLVFKTVNGIQTIPSLALFGLMIAPLALLSRQFPVLRSLGIAGIGTAPALIALSLYSLLPIIRNTFTAIYYIEPQIISAAHGMGMNRAQTFRYIELPLSTPMILTGIRMSLVQCIGNTAVAALIGAGGLGTFIFQGLGQSVPDLILLGVIPVILLSILFDRLFHLAEHWATPKGVRLAWGN